MKIRQIITSVAGEIKLVVTEDGKVFELVNDSTLPDGKWKEYEIGKEIENDL